MDSKSITTARQLRSAQLLKLRLEKKIDRLTMSKLSGLHLATIYRLESGEISWNIDSELIYVNTLKNISL